MMPQPKDGEASDDGGGHRKQWSASGSARACQLPHFVALLSHPRHLPRNQIPA